MASNLVRWGIPSIALLLAALFVAGVYAAERRVFDASRARRHALFAALGISGLMAFIAALALSGLLGRFDLRPPPLMLWMISTLGAALAVGLSPLGRRLATELRWSRWSAFKHSVCPSSSSCIAPRSRASCRASCRTVATTSTS